MNCVQARDRLAERALGALAHGDGVAVERHLTWCAACRKEAEDLSHAAATLSFALPPASPPADLEQRVIATVRGARTGGHSRRRTPRTGVALAVAVAVAISALGWGSVMAGRADRFRFQAQEARERQERVAEEFSEVIREFVTPGSEVYLGTLGPTDGRSGGGFALALDLVGRADIGMVRVVGVRADTVTFPLSASFVNEETGDRLGVGRIDSLDTGGSNEVGRDFRQDLAGFTRVVVRDADGEVVMQGTLTPRAPVATIEP